MNYPMALEKKSSYTQTVIIYMYMYLFDFFLSAGPIESKKKCVYQSLAFQMYCAILFSYMWKQDKVITEGLFSLEIINVIAL